MIIVYDENKKAMIPKPKAGKSIEQSQFLGGTIVNHKSMKSKNPITNQYSFTKSNPLFGFGKKTVQLKTNGELDSIDVSSNSSDQELVPSTPMSISEILHWEEKLEVEKYVEIPSYASDLSSKWWVQSKPELCETPKSDSKFAWEVDDESDMEQSQKDATDPIEIKSPIIENSNQSTSEKIEQVFTIKKRIQKYADKLSDECIHKRGKGRPRKTTTITENIIEVNNNHESDNSER